MGTTEIYFVSVEDLYDHVGDEDFLDDLVDYQEHAGKHDCTNCSGYYEALDGHWWKVTYSASYYNGIEGIWLRGPFLQDKVVVEVNKYREVNANN